MRIAAIDHLVLTVRSLEATCAFYGGVLGMEIVRFGEGRTALAFGAQKLNLHEHGREFEPKAAHPVPGAIDLCLLTDEPLDDVAAHLARHGVAVVEGPVVRTGATGPICSVYVRDPDGNLVEIANRIG